MTVCLSVWQSRRGDGSYFRLSSSLGSSEVDHEEFGMVDDATNAGASLLFDEIDLEDGVGARRSLVGIGWFLGASCVSGEESSEDFGRGFSLHGGESGDVDGAFGILSQLQYTRLGY